MHAGGFLSQLYNISFTINTDGVNKYSSSKAGHLWPVYIMINELPKEHRFKKKFIIPAYIYCDKHDPNMLTYLNPLVEKLNVLNATGIHVPDSADGDINVRCMLFEATADLMNMKRFNGKCACHLCKSEGSGYGTNNIHRYWPYKQSPEKRTHEDQVQYASKATIKQAVMGVKGHSYPFDLVRSFAIDWMHCVCLGVVRYIMQKQMSDGNQENVFYRSKEGIYVPKTSFDKAARHCREIAQAYRRPPTLESHRAQKLATALFCYSFIQFLKSLVHFSLVSCQSDRKFLF